MTGMRSNVSAGKILGTILILVLAFFYANSRGLIQPLQDAVSHAASGETSIEVPGPFEGDIDATEAADRFEQITIEGLQPITYDREGQFGRAWMDVDGNGCDTRNDILARDLTSITLDDDDCTVLTGTLLDPYTGKTIDFERGVRTSSKVQIDHIVPLHRAAQSGALDWDQDTREAFANDPINLIASDGPANMSKGDRGPGDWLPANEAFHCDYVAAYVSVIDTYDLAMPAGDARAAQEVLATC
ncbi:DUF1524 domain-containing protein [Pseudactinotalea sp. HY160]|uniref:HNH endonuclease family protein n=1 Tax=Pseudactinotalea sp. HY160 TaxID=2654490 RepID=UPI00128E3F47|nr:HNH endonuclease family protein [Pseudactinotalea sp. HY160]MPV51031.1 DUF1524 domain-containing protein [Pseudactinotalea sp. HY160]